MSAISGLARTKYKDRRLPKKGEIWERIRDGKRVEVVTAPRAWWELVWLYWPDTGRTTRKRAHYFLDAFAPTDTEDET